MAYSRPQSNAVENPTVLPFPFTIKWQQTHTIAAGGETKKFELGKAPIAAIFLNIDCLGNGAAATVANLNGLLTSMKVTDGGADITPLWSGAEWYEYIAAFTGRLPPFQDGTAADNKLALQQLVIPFGRPLGTKHPSPLSMFDPLVGFKPKAVPLLEMVFAADGSNIDNRHIKIGVMYYNGSPRFTKKWTDWSSLTLSTSGFTDWILPSYGQLLEIFMYRTSSYNDTLTSDSPTLLKWNLTQNSRSMITDGEMFDIFGALEDTYAQPDDDYLLIPFVQNTMMDLSLAPRLGNDTRFKAYGGVADALTCAFSVISP